MRRLLPAGRGPEQLSEAERGRATLSLGIIALRWATLAWMAVVAGATADDLRRPLLVWVGVAVTLAWTTWLTVVRPQLTFPVLLADLALAIGLIVLSGYVSEPGALNGEGPGFSTAYPVAAAVTWGAAKGFRFGVLAGLALGVALVAARVVNGESLESLRTDQALSLASGAVNFLLAGGAMGILARLLDRSASELRAVQEDNMRARERAARLAERESLARQIHDSVLQSLAMVHKRGRELAEAGSVPAAEVARLAELAGGQERILRQLVLREPGEVPTGRASLREALEGLAGVVEGPKVTVSAVGPLLLPTACVEELAAAARQALENAARHANAATVSVFAEDDEDEIVVTIRDDGDGFTYDEDALREAGKIGMLKSMKGRAEHLGGRMCVDSAPGRGTEIELRVPADQGEAAW